VKHRFRKFKRKANWGAGIDVGANVEIRKKCWATGRKTGKEGKGSIALKHGAQTKKRLT